MTGSSPARRILKSSLVSIGASGLVPRSATWLERIDPSLRLAARQLPPAPPIAVVAVYRARNAAIVSRLLAALPPGSPIALWALDAPVPALAPVTIGAGAGGRFTLLNRCAEALELQDDRWLIASDDDVAIRRGDLGTAVRVARAAGLDLSQPAHAWQSNMSWRYNRRRFMVVARRGRFVEIGPIVILSPLGRRLVLPFPEDTGMGWGTEAAWAALESQGLHLGVLDCVLMDHAVPTGGDYGTDVERARERAVVDAHGLRDLRVLQRDADVWFAWQRPHELRGDVG